MGTICLQCGDKGSPNAFVYCVKCLNFAVHRYCLDVIPETLDEFVHWVCGDDCEGEAQNQSTICNHIVSENVKGTRDHIVPEIIELFPGIGIKENDLRVGPEKSFDACTKVDLVDCSPLPEDERKICQLSEAEKDRGKKSKKRKRRIVESVIDKGEHILGNVTSCKKENKKRVKVACDAKLPAKAKDDEGSKQRDEKQISVKSSKKKKKKTIISFTENLLENNQRAEEEAAFACDTKLPSTVKDDEGNKQRDERRISLRSSKKKKKKTILSSEEHLLEDKAHIFGDQRVEEKAISACDGKLPSKVKDDKGSEQRDEKCISLKSSKKKKKKRKKIVISSENKSVKLENQSVEKNTEVKKHSPSKAYMSNGELEDREKRTSADSDKNNLCEDFPEDLHISSAEPVAMPIWRGSFSIWNEKRGIVNGLLAHVSILACPKVYDEALQFQPVLRLEMLPKSDVWPKSFETSEPRGDNIALYFFPSKSSEQDFDHLVDEMTRNELALKAIVQNAELLIFNSSELPLLYWKFQGKYYLWGVFRQKQSTPSNSHPCRMELKDKNPIKHTDETAATPEGHYALSPRSPLSNSASYGSHT